MVKGLVVFIRSELFTVRESRTGFSVSLMVDVFVVAATMPVVEIINPVNKGTVIKNRIVCINALFMLKK
jgi:hypothetical protein